MKPSVYIETTVIGYLTSWPRNDVIVTGRQAVTKKWWQTAHDKYTLVVSQKVVDECAAGDAIAAEERLRVIENLPIVEMSPAAERLLNALLAKGAVPATEPNDAAHIALAAANGVQFLVTWNFRHIANVSMRRKIDQIIMECGFQALSICSPDEMSEDPGHVD